MTALLDYLDFVKLEFHIVTIGENNNMHCVTTCTGGGQKTTSSFEVHFNVGINLTRNKSSELLSCSTSFRTLVKLIRLRILSFV